MPARPQKQCQKKIANKKIAILYDQEAKFSPSNKEAIALFQTAAQELGLDTIVLPRSASITLEAVDGLFIRDTTHPGDYTYQYALLAQELGLPVLDSPQDILKGCNKFWQLEAFKQYEIPHPQSYIIARESFLHVAGRLEYPVVIKKHDGCFSQGVYLANNRDEFLNHCKQIFRQPVRCLIVQKFIKTDFDWRLCYFQKKLLFACKYYMVQGDWKIAKYDRKGKHVQGRHECIAPADLNPELKLAAEKCLEFLGNGLWGIDLKHTEDGVYVIETNDNPSIDAGVEDGLEKSIYKTIMGYFI
jgi:glutathione synthase/RimK-type ligase-like ATP-grasp enzyme